MQLARVALPVPLGQAFTYQVPLHLQIQVGMRVLVPWGRRMVLGVVVETESALPPELTHDKLKPIESVLDQEPALNQELFSFLLELARYYFAPLGEVFRLALPALERKAAHEIERTTGKKWKAVGRLVQQARALTPATGEAPAELPRSARARELLELLQREGPQEVSQLQHSFPSARSQLKQLAAQGWVELTQVEKQIDPFFLEPAERDVPPPLNADQSRAVQALCDSLNAHSARSFLLDGVTASGKTEVYLHAAQHALQQQRGVILLVPEIALTPQLVARFRARLGDEIAVLHSGLTEVARLAMWQNLRQGKLRVVIGARSALFAPVQNLGLICVDEEHDPSYKQEEGVRYNARDMALWRAKRAQAVCVLGSATPSLHSIFAVRNQQMERLVLSQRAHPTAQLPQIEIVDLTRMGPGPSGDPLLSLPLHRAIEANLEQKGQTILFLNRRGFAPSLICQSCGEIFHCPHCAVPMTYHRAGGTRLECHYCDLRLPVPSSCTSCQSPHLSEEGLGTERVEALLTTQFPSARIARLDRDVAAGAKSEKILARMRAQEIDILVGTQMVAKGHDLPQVTLVGVLNADAALSLPDFRAEERTFQLLVQVAGRAGRAGTQGRVLIQTRNPAHPAVAYAVTHDVSSFIEQEMLARDEVGYPPFSYLALIRLDGLDEAQVRQEAARLARLAGQAAPPVEVLGPAPAPVTKVRNRYRYRILLRAENRPPLRASVLAILRAPTNRRVRVSVDIDPVGTL